MDENTLINQALAQAQVSMQIQSAYFAMVLSACGGEVKVTEQVAMALPDEFEIVVVRDNDNATFKLLTDPEEVKRVREADKPSNTAATGILIPNS